MLTNPGNSLLVSYFSSENPQLKIFLENQSKELLNWLDNLTSDKISDLSAKYSNQMKVEKARLSSRPRAKLISALVEKLHLDFEKVAPHHFCTKVYKDLSYWVKEGRKTGKFLNYRQSLKNGA